MEQAKQAVSSFLSGGGKQRTDVNEVVNPAVTSETVKPHRHEETTEAVNREVHQDHYHTTVQPLAHKEVLPEQHQHNIAPQVERTFEHGSTEHDRGRVAADLGQFRDTSTTANTTHSTSAAPVVAGEHVHHHVHETVQPVIHKETIQPEVVHTTIPIHEKHIAPSEHHGLSSLPVKTMDEFQQRGVNLTEGHHGHNEYEGHPKPYNAAMQLERNPVDINPAAHSGTHDPEKTGHFDHLRSGSGTGGSTGTTAATSTNPLHQNTTEHHGSGLGAGAAAGAAAGVGATALSGNHGGNHPSAGHLGQDRGLDSTAVGHSSSGSHLGQDRHLDSSTVGHSSSGNHLGQDRALGSNTAGTSADTESSIPGRENARAHHITTANEPLSGTTTSGTHTGSSGHHEHRDDVSSSARDETSGTSTTAHHDHHSSEIGEDPRVVEKREAEIGKWRGDGVPGSHSAVFGLTKTGEAFDDTSKFSPGAPHSTKNEHDSKHGSGLGGETGSKSHDTGSGKIAEQMDNPRAAEPAHGGGPDADRTSSNTKPGFGGDTSKII